MGISQVPPVPVPTAKGEIVVGTPSGPTKITANTTANFSLITDPTTTTGLKYGQTGKVWTCYSGGVNYSSVTGNWSGGYIGYVTTTVYYLGGTYIFGTNTGAIGYSTDAKTWNYQAIFGSSIVINAIAYNGTTWVVAANSNNLRSATTLGGTWTARTSQLGGTATIYDVIWVGGSINLFLLCGDANGASTPRITSSPDGITWTSRFAPAATDTYFMLAVNTSNNTIVCANNNSTANTQAAYSTNGTTWAAAPVSSAATQFYGRVTYFPHVDKFAVGTSSGTSGNFLRSSASVATASWNTAPYENMQYQNSVYAYASGDGIYKKFRPIWDSVNQRYYSLDFNWYGQAEMLNTFGNSNNVSSYQTGSFTNYQLDMTASEYLPPIRPAQYGSTNPDPYQAGSIGYGNGIWVYVGNTFSSYNNNRGGVVVFSTAA